MILRVLVVACCAALFCHAASAQRAPEEAARIGVMPVALPPGASDSQRAQAERYTRALTEAIAKQRPDVITLGVPGDPAPSPSSHRERRALALAEGRRLLIGQVLSAWLRGRGVDERLGIELLDDGGELLWSVEVRPQQEGSAWPTSVTDRLRADVAPESPPPRAAAAPAAVPASPSPSPAPAPIAAAADGLAKDGLDEDESALPWIVGSSGAVLIVGGLAALAVGAVYGGLAWDESTRLVKLHGGDPQRGALERSSLQKAALADVLFASAGLLVLVGASATSAAVFFLE